MGLGCVSREGGGGLCDATALLGIMCVRFCIGTPECVAMCCVDVLLKHCCKLQDVCVCLCEMNKLWDLRRGVTPRFSLTCIWSI